MSLLSDLFNFDRKPKAPAESAAPARPGIEVYHAVIDLITVSNELKAQLSSDVQRAFEAPQSFYQEDEYTLAERGLRFPKDGPLTPKFVLIDTLINHGQMAEVDWKASEEDLRFALNEILAAKGFPLDLPAAEQYDDPDTFSVFESIEAEELQPRGYCLAFLDIDSDSYVFTVVPLVQQPQVEELLAKLK
jgi:hypothetical protein